FTYVQWESGDSPLYNEREAFCNRPYGTGIHISGPTRWTAPASVSAHPLSVSRLLKNSMSTVEGGRIGDGKPSSASYGWFLGHPDAIDFSRFRICRVFQQPVKYSRPFGVNSASGSIRKRRSRRAPIGLLISCASEATSSIPS